MLVYVVVLVCVGRAFLFTKALWSAKAPLYVCVCVCVFMRVFVRGWGTDVVR